MKKKYVNEDQELVRTILGKDKFLMLNMVMIKKLTPNVACMLTFIMDKCEYLLKTGQIESASDGFYVYRRDFKNKLGLSEYQQKQVENSLNKLGLMTVKEIRVNGETWNEYRLDIYNIAELVENTDEDPLKKFNPPPKETLPCNYNNTIIS